MVKIKNIHLFLPKLIFFITFFLLQVKKNRLVVKNLILILIKSKSCYRDQGNPVPCQDYPGGRGHGQCWCCHWPPGSKGKGTQDICNSYTDKKENQIFLIYMEILNGAVAKSYMTTASSYMVKCLRISSYMYIRKPFLMYDFAIAPFWISLCKRKIWFSFLSVYKYHW